MFEGSRLSYVVPGYTGYIPKVRQDDPLQAQEKEPNYQIPGYAGYISSQKSENLFGKTYGKITYNLSKEDFHQGQDVPPEQRYSSMSQDTFVDQQKVLKRTAAEIVGVPNYRNSYAVDENDVKDTKYYTESQKFYQNIQEKQNEQKGNNQFEKNINSFYGDNEAKSIKLNDPLPGYTGFNKRVQAGNIFGQTYANARRTAHQDQSNIENEKINNFKLQSTIHPPLKK